MSRFQNTSVTNATDYALNSDEPFLFFSISSKYFPPIHKVSYYCAKTLTSPYIPPKTKELNCLINPLPIMMNPYSFPHSLCPPWSNLCMRGNVLYLSRQVYRNFWHPIKCFSVISSFLPYSHSISSV